MRSSGEPETYQVEQRSYRVNDKKSREGVASGRREAEVSRALAGTK